mmetsp:Transcript_5503/g.17632  ORF Transcript_5503/g.17632 Transcript_5503/m.17632 type:complete len:251 (+) Transcript_5503:1944-2696(+)
MRAVFTPVPKPTATLTRRTVSDRAIGRTTARGRRGGSQARLCRAPWASCFRMAMNRSGRAAAWTFGGMRVALAVRLEQSAVTLFPGSGLRLGSSAISICQSHCESWLSWPVSSGPRIAELTAGRIKLAQWKPAKVRRPPASANTNTLILCQLTHTIIYRWGLDHLSACEEGAPARRPSGEWSAGWYLGQSAAMPRFHQTCLPPYVPARLGSRHFGGCAVDGSRAGRRLRKQLALATLHVQNNDAAQRQHR